MEGHLINLRTAQREFKDLFDVRLTAARAGKIDRLDTTISSRASATGQSTTHGKLNTNKAAIDGVRSVVNAIKGKTDLLKSTPPTGGSSGRAYWNTSSPLSSYILTVSGSGVLRQSFMIDESKRATMTIIIDGYTVAITEAKSFNVAEGGIRFNSYFKIHIAASGSIYSRNNGWVDYSYTLGD